MGSINQKNPVYLYLAKTPMSTNRQLAAILFAEIKGFNHLLEGDELEASHLRGKLKKFLDQEIEVHNGRILDSRSDIVLCSFNSAIEAVRAAISLQREMLNEPKIPLSIGIHEGDVVFTDDDVIGDGVNIASRIESFAVPGSVLISERIQEDCRNQIDIKTVSLGLYTLKNVTNPVAIYAISNEGFVIPKREDLKGKGSRFTTTRRWLIPGGIALFVVAGIVLYLQLSSSTSSIDKSIAVLPFVDMSERHDQEYFSDGLSEEIMNHLAQIPTLKVISRTSSFAFKGKNEDLRTIGEKLGVAHILEGSVRRDKNKVRITAKLVKTADGTQLWSETFDREMDDVFTVQNEISRAVVGQLKETLINKGAESVTGNPEVYNLILQGRYYLEQSDDASTIKALGLFNQALEIDSSNSMVRALLAGAYINLAGTEFLDMKPGIARARREAEIAIALDPRLPEGYLAMGRIKQLYDWDWKGAEAEYLKALDIDSENSQAIHRMASLKRTLGEFDEAIRLFKKSIERDPVNTRHYSSLGLSYLNAHRFEEAKMQYRKVVKMNPSFGGAHTFISAIYVITGKADSAMTEIQRETDDGWKACYSPLVYFAAGNKTEADRALDQCITDYHDDWAFQIAQNYAWRGDNDNCFKWLDQAYLQHDGGLKEIVGDPFLGRVTDDPRYWQFMEKMNLEEEARKGER